MYCVIVTIVALLYASLDVNHFIRIGLTIGLGRLFQRKFGIHETNCIYGVCTTHDVDIFLTHMNNARYVRELDFARFHFYDRNGLYGNLVALNGLSAQGASSIRYRRMIPFLAAYKIETKLVYWEDKTLYIEHKFITLRDQFVRAVVLSRQNLIGVDVTTLIEGLSGAEQKPTCPPEIDHWIKSNEISSAKLRKND